MQNVSTPHLSAPLPRAFYQRSAAELAPALIGKILVHRLPDRILRARIVETEAYLGPRDLASHSSKGRTARTEVMFKEAGHAYVYLIYGLHFMLNIVAGENGAAHGVLLRAAEPLDGWNANLRGPGNLARGFTITRAHYGCDITAGTLFVTETPGDPPRIRRTARIGVDYAGHWKGRLLRFIDPSSKHVSK